VYVSLGEGVLHANLALWEPTALAVPMLGAPAVRAFLRRPMPQVLQAPNFVCASLGLGLTHKMVIVKLLGSAHASNVLRVPSQMVETGQSAPSAMLCCPIALDPMGLPMLMIVCAKQGMRALTAPNALVVVTALEESWPP